MLMILDEFIIYSLITCVMWSYFTFYKFAQNYKGSLLFSYFSYEKDNNQLVDDHLWDVLLLVPTTVSSNQILVLHVLFIVCG